MKFFWTHSVALLLDLARPFQIKYAYVLKLTTTYRGVQFVEGCKRTGFSRDVEPTGRE